ncbi:hypothetical protein [Pseudoalteromonas piscicida]|uniref:hypothetical protein n=1 Tax=Pseudoalteromonas piscicida TaxID=43662 RepID=UPI001F5B653E|nr:hypothetical protein [Pseudoalteromonas piscicida]
MQTFFIRPQLSGLDDVSMQSVPEFVLLKEGGHLDSNKTIEHSDAFKQNLAEAIGFKPPTKNKDTEGEPLKFQFADYEVLFDVTKLTEQDEAVLEKLKVLLAEIMTSPITPNISSKDQSQLQLFESLALDFLAYKELSKRLEMLAKLDHETENQTALVQQDKDRIRAVIASLHARLEKGQEAVLGGTTLKALDLNRKDFELELNCLFSSQSFDSNNPVTDLF